MKLEQLYTEAAGVPQGLVESSIYVYSKILDKFKQFSSSKEGFNYDSNREVLYAKFAVDPARISVGNFTPSRVTVTIEIKIHENKALKKNQISTAELAYRSKINWQDFSIAHDGSEIGINIFIDAPAIDSSKFFIGLYNFVKSSKSNIVSSMSHELKHFYDSKARKKNEKISSTVMYNAYTSLVYKTNFKPIYTFIFNLYYTTNTENLVRPSEVYSDAISKKISKKDFYKFLTSHQNFVKAKELQKYTYDDLKNEIANNIGVLDEFIADSNFEEFKGKDLSSVPVQEKVNVILKVVFDVIRSGKLSILNRYINRAKQEVPDIKMGSVLDSAEKVKQEATRFKNFDAFFRDEIKRFNRVGNDTIRKMAKVQSLLKEKRSRS